jgi:hypothetical protein
MNRYQTLAAGFAAAACIGFSAITPAQTALEGVYLSALAPENLARPRAAAPFDLTGTWNMVIDPETGMHEFLPMPKLTPAAQAEYDKYLEYLERGLEYRDDPGACWPLGMPRMMTRFWPVQIIQLPTMVQLTTMFNNSVRWIFTDGRPHPPEDLLVYTFNGHSIGRWEGDTLVVDTISMAGDHQWIQAGIPASDALHIVERYRMADDGNSFEVEFTMTDPENWEGEWTNTKRFVRQNRTDIEEHVCIYEQMRELPSFDYNVRE